MKTLKEMIKVMQDAADGFRIERTGNRSGEKAYDPEPKWDWIVWDYNIAPHPKRVPLGPEDVPPGSLLDNDKSRSGKTWIMVQRVDREGVYIINDTRLISHWKWHELVDYRISIDDGKTWGPCSKEVQS